MKVNEQRCTADTPEKPAGTEIIGQDPAMQEVFRAIGRLANSNVTVLILGASGSGKELVAKALHRHSPRANANFVALNMAAIPRELVESELFGHEKGAFTGAQLAPHRPFRAGQRRDAVSRRNRRHATGNPDPAAASARRWRVLPRRWSFLHQGRRTHHCRHPPESGDAGAR